MRNLSIALDPTRRNTEAAAFAKAMHRSIVGQEEAVEQVAEIYQTFLAGFNPPGRPVANMLFMGPTGSGKTRVVEAMAQALFADPRACIKVDCAEFQHSHEVAKLIGSPPGYLGHRETQPLLNQAAIDKWQTEEVKLSILLFDEIEKASDALWQLLLGILDKGTLTLGNNNRVDLSRCVIIMTSNLGAAEMSNLASGRFGFSPRADVYEDGFDKKMERTAVEAARRKFTPEFMNRIDKVVVFKTLHEEHLKQILELELEMVQQRILAAPSSKKFLFDCSESVENFLLREGTDPKYGARHLKRAIEKNLVCPLASLVATSQLTFGDFVRIDLVPDGRLIFTKTAERAVPSKLRRSEDEGGENTIAASAIKSLSSPIACCGF